MSKKIYFTSWPDSEENKEVDRGLDRFERYKERFVAILRDAWNRGPKVEPLDVDRAWRDLTSVASVHLQRKTRKRKAVPAGERSKRLGKIAKALGEACCLLDEARRDDLIKDLYSPLRDQFEKEGECVNELKLDEMVVVVPRALNEIIATLSKLHAAACQARDDVVPQKGRPQGSILDEGIITSLAHNYELSTGLTLDTPTREHFVKLVGTFLEATGKPRKDGSVLEAIKYAYRET
jgi:hypothetical protein